MNENFQCRQCGACCRIEGIVRLKDDDPAKIAAHLGMSEADFIAHETEIAPDRRGLVLKDRADGACAMLDENNRCRIYPSCSSDSAFPGWLLPTRIHLHFQSLS